MQPPGQAGPRAGASAEPLSASWLRREQRCPGRGVFLAPQSSGGAGFGARPVTGTSYPHQRRRLIQITRRRKRRKKRTLSGRGRRKRRRRRRCGRSPPRRPRVPAAPRPPSPRRAQALGRAPSSSSALLSFQNRHSPEHPGMGSSQASSSSSLR